VRSFSRFQVVAFFLTLSLFANLAAAQFTTVIDAPPTVIGSNQSIGSDTQLNVLPGGSVGLSFDAGNSAALQRMFK
jgi:hypothetical protein